jgi:hypothetical protein
MFARRLAGELKPGKPMAFQGVQGDSVGEKQKLHFLPIFVYFD